MSGTTTDTDDARWVAVVNRDHGSDGAFLYSVRTTGVYCRPSCSSRLARRENVSFHPSAAAARRAGFRPCKRCRPDEPPAARQQAMKVAAACRLIEQSDPAPDLGTVAASVELSPSHFHRLFKAFTGVTPKAYAIAHRNGRVRAGLATKRSVTEVIHEAGFTSSGRFYADSTRTLGMTPTRFREGGVDTTIRFAVGDCLLGSILVAATDKGICTIQLGEDPGLLVHQLQDRFPRADLIGGDEAFDRLVAAVVGMVERPVPAPDLQLDVRGTVFQLRVWQALREIPVGSTASYSEIARRLGKPGASRAVAQACAANPAAVAIPCHRVVRSDGGIGGYRWGVERKRTLLAQESA